MKHNAKTVAVISSACFVALFVAGFCSGDALVAPSDLIQTESDAKVHANAVLQRIDRVLGQGPDVIRRTSESGANRSWHVTDTECSLTLRASDGLLTSLRFSKRQEEAIRNVREGDKFFPNQSAVLARCAVLMERLDVAQTQWSDHRFAARPSNPQASNQDKNTLTVVFMDKPFGYPTNGFGNSVQITLDAYTGNLIWLMQSHGYSYNPPDIRKSDAQAKALAKTALIVRGYTGRGEPVGAVLCYVPGATRGPFMHASAATWRQQKRLRLAYSVSFRGATVDIDATTGECIDGGIMR